MPKDINQVIYQGRLITLSTEKTQLPNGHSLDLEIVRHPGGAVVVALNKQDQVCLLRQYRHAVNESRLWELPAGCIDTHDATPLATAQRELREEAGLSAGNWIELGRALPSPGFCDEVIHLFLARDLSDVDKQQQHDEIIEIHWLPLTRAVSMAASGEIYDAKSVMGLFRAHWCLNRGQYTF